MYRTVENADRPAMSGLRDLLTETITGGLIGALGGAISGLLFGVLCWAAFGQVAAVWAFGAQFLRACAAAGAVASLSTQLFAAEPLGWREFLVTRTNDWTGPKQAPASYSFLSGADMVIRTTGQAMRISDAPPAGSANGRVSPASPKTGLG
jgi:hypothetical protein